MNNITCPVYQQSLNNPEAIALIQGDRSLNYGQFHKQIDKACEFLQNNDVKKGMRVALLGPLSDKYIAVLYALWRVEAVACPLDPHLPKQAIIDRIKQISCELLLNFNTATLECDEIRAVPVENLDLQKEIKNDDPFCSKIDPEQYATIIFTSGTTRDSKAVVHSFGNHYLNAQASNENICLSKGDKWLLSLPLYHVAGIGILFRAFLSGAAVVIPENRKDIISDLKRHRVTHLSLVGTQLWRILKQDRAVLKDVKAILLGGGFVQRDLVKDIAEKKLPVYVTYGLTESSSQAATSDKPLYKMGGEVQARPLKHTEIKITDEGEICLRGAVIFKGYLKNDRIEDPLKDGWFHTGDLGKIKGGYLTVKGRKDNMFISGGENVYPEEIERVIMDMPEVEIAVVIAVEDDEFDKIPVGFVKFISSSLERDRIKGYLAGQLPSYKIPKKLYHWSEEFEAQGIKFGRKLILEYYRSQPLSEII